MNVDGIREDFPLLKVKMNDKPLCYLDNAATSLKPQQVIDSIANYYSNVGASVHRGVYKLSHDATNLYEEARDKVAKFINANKKEEIVFTKGTSESSNMIAYYFHKILKQGDEIVVTSLDHHSLLLPWQRVAEVTGAKLVYVPLDSDGRITMDNFKKVINKSTKVVTISHVSNVMGYIAPIKKIIEESKKYDAKVVVDAAQSIPHIKVDVKDLDCDFLVFSGHKMCGPTGIGVLYGKYNLLQDMEPLYVGGTMSDIVEENKATYKDAPYKFEAGTPIISGAIGLGVAIDYLNNIGMDEIHKREILLKDFAIKQLSAIDGVEILNKNTDTGIITFNIEGVHPHDAASIYDLEGIAVRAGHHCAQLAMKFLCQASTLRASFYFYNTYEEIQKFVDATKKAKEFFCYE